MIISSEFYLRIPFTIPYNKGVLVIVRFSELFSDDPKFLTAITGSIASELQYSNVGF